MKNRTALCLPALAVLLTLGAEPGTPFQKVTAFKTTVSYRFTCTQDVYTIAIEALSQVPSGGESTLYWEIWESGQTSLAGMQNVATLNTLAVQAALGASAEHDTGVGLVSKIYRPCAGQSLYIWAASGATRLPNGDVDVSFADAVEQPLSQP